MLGKFWLYAYAYGMCIKPFEELPLVIKAQFKDSGKAASVTHLVVSLFPGSD